MTREEMEQVIVRGGSVSYKGRVISRMQDLPSAAELAAGDAEATTRELTRLDAQIADLTAQRDALAASQPPAKTKKEST